MSSAARRHCKSTAPDAGARRPGGRPIAPVSQGGNSRSSSSRRPARPGRRPVRALVGGDGVVDPLVGAPNEATHGGPTVARDLSDLVVLVAGRAQEGHLAERAVGADAARRLPLRTRLSLGHRPKCPATTRRDRAYSPTHRTAPAAAAASRDRASMPHAAPREQATPSSCAPDSVGARGIGPTRMCRRPRCSGPKSGPRF